MSEWHYSTISGTLAPGQRSSLRVCLSQSAAWNWMTITSVDERSKGHKVSERHNLATSPLLRLLLLFLWTSFEPQTFHTCNQVGLTVFLYALTLKPIHLRPDRLRRCRLKVTDRESMVLLSWGCTRPEKPNARSTSASIALMLQGREVSARLPASLRPPLGPRVLCRTVWHSARQRLIDRLALGEPGRE